MSFARPLVVLAVLLPAILVEACTGEDPDLAHGDASGGDASTPPAPTSSSSGDTGAPATPAEACAAKLPASRACYTGPDGTRGKGICKDGELTCLATGDTSCAGEVVPAAADPCNDLDDDCNGVVDDGIDKKTSPLHCGGCNQPCAANEACSEGVCHERNETACSDGVDNDGDGDTDCADTECEQQSCGVGCTCVTKVKIETSCGDGLDNDGDGLTDCADPNCTTCGTGCACTAGKKVESNCSDGVDNDGDAKSDCADSDCANKPCKKAGGATGTCVSNACM